MRDYKNSAVTGNCLFLILAWLRGDFVRVGGERSLDRHAGSATQSARPLKAAAGS